MPGRKRQKRAESESSPPATIPSKPLPALPAEIWIRIFQILCGTYNPKNTKALLTLASQAWRVASVADEFIWATSMIRVGKRSGSGELLSEADNYCNVLRHTKHVGLTLPFGPLSPVSAQDTHLGFKGLMDSFMGHKMTTLVFSRHTAMRRDDHEVLDEALDDLPNLKRFMAPKTAFHTGRSVVLNAYASYSDGREFWYQSGADLDLSLKYIQRGGTPTSLALFGRGGNTRPSDYATFFRHTRMFDGQNRLRVDEVTLVKTHLLEVTKFVSLNQVIKLTIWDSYHLDDFFRKANCSLVERFSWMEHTDPDEVRGESARAFTDFTKRLTSIRDFSVRHSKKTSALSRFVPETLPPGLRSFSCVLGDLYCDPVSWNKRYDMYSKKFKELEALHLPISSVTSMLDGEGWSGDGQFTTYLRILAKMFRGCAHLKRLALSGPELRPAHGNPNRAHEVSERLTKVAHRVASEFQNVGIHLQTISIHLFDNILEEEDAFVPIPRHFRIVPARKQGSIRVEPIDPFEIPEDDEEAFAAMGLSYEHTLAEHVHKRMPFVPYKEDIQKHWTQRWFRHDEARA